MKLQTGYKRLSDWGWRIIPVLGLTGITAFALAQQIVTPQQRMIKLSVVLALLTMMLRFDMIYSLYLFIFLFPFPSSISIGSTNSIMMTLIVLIWFVRANSEKVRFFYSSGVDKFVVLLLISYLLSFFNVDSMDGIIQGLKIVWRQAAAIALFYLVLRFIDSEEKLEKLTKIIALAAGLVFLTGLFEIFAPGTTIIPGWIGLKTDIGGYAARLKGVRVGGAVGSHSIISDYATLTLFFMGYHFIRAKNPFWRVAWLAIGLMTFAVMLATANRGAFFGFLLGVIYFMWVFRRNFTLAKYVVFITLAVCLFAVGEYILTEYTNTLSLTDRIMATWFQGVVPDSRTNTWKPALAAATDHIILGSGPQFRLGKGLTALLWPHNSFIFYLYTLGIVGLTAFLLVLYRVFRLSLSYRKPFLRGTNLQTLAALFHIQLLMSVFEQMRTDHQRDDIYMYIIWLLFALIVASSRVIRNREAEYLARMKAASLKEPGGGNSARTVSGG